MPCPSFRRLLVKLLRRPAQPARRQAGAIGGLGGCAVVIVKGGGPLRLARNPLLQLPDQHESRPLVRRIAFPLRNRRAVDVEERSHLGLRPAERNSE